MKKPSILVLLSGFFITGMLLLSVALPPKTAFAAASATINFAPTATTAVVSGTLSGDTYANFNGLVTFSYGLTTGNELGTITVPVASNLSYSFTVSPLTAATTYHYVLLYLSVPLSGPATFTTSAATSTGTTQTGSTTTGAVQTIHIQLDNPLGATKTLPDLMLKVLDGAILLLTPLVVIMILYAGFLFVAARGNGEKLAEAKKVLMYVLIGAAIIVCAKGLAIAVQATVSCLAGSTSCTAVGPT